MEPSLTAESDTARRSTVGQRLLRLAPTLLTLAIVTAWVAVELNHLDFFSFEDDEGTFLLTARSVYDGYVLYRAVWFNYLSGLMNLLVLVFRVGGVSLTGPRALMVVLTAITMLLASRIARRAFGRWAGALTALLLVLVPAVSSMGRSAMAEIPATVCGALAILALQTHLRSGRLVWVAVAGFLGGLGVWFKYPAVVLLGVLAIGLWAGAWQRHLSWRAIIGQTALLVGAALLPVAVAILAYDPAAQWDQIIGTLLRAQHYYHLKLLANIGKLAGYMESNNAALPLLALLGTLDLARRDRAQAWLLGSWLWLYLLSMEFSTPLAPHHMFLFAAPLAILAAGALYTLPETVQALRRHTLVGGQRIASGMLLASTLLLFALWPECIESLGSLHRDDTRKREDWYEASAIVAENSAPGDYVICDFPMITFRAGRSAPPWLTNLSGMRFRTEGITEEQIREATEIYAPALIVFWESKFANSTPDYIADIQKTYREIYREDEEMEDGTLRLHGIYQRPDLYEAAHR